MTDYKTIDELMEGKEWGDIKITYKRWDDCCWLRPFYRDKDGDWFGLDEVRELLTVDGNDPCWTLYKEPQEALYRWAYFDFNISLWVERAELRTEAQARRWGEDRGYKKYEKTGGPFYFGGEG